MGHSSIATTQRYDKRNPDPGNCTLRGDVQEFSVLFAEFLQDFSGYNGEFLHFPVRMQPFDPFLGFIWRRNDAVTDTDTMTLHVQR